MSLASRQSVLWLLFATGGIGFIATAANLERAPSPQLDEHSAKGLQIHCVPTKTNFLLSEPVILWCTVTNTTDAAKPIAWHPSTGPHFRLVKDEASWMTGILPQVTPRLPDSIKIKPSGAPPECILLLPPHSSLQLLLTYKPERPGKMKGLLVYDPVTHGGGFFGDEAIEKARRACVFSGMFEYEVTLRGRKP